MEVKAAEPIIVDHNGYRARLVTDDDELPELLDMINESYELDDRFFLEYDGNDYDRTNLELLTAQLHVRRDDMCSSICGKDQCNMVFPWEQGASKGVSGSLTAFSQYSSLPQ